MLKKAGILKMFVNVFSVLNTILSDLNKMLAAQCEWCANDCEAVWRVDRMCV